jgi:hypothetical protein
MRNAKSLRRRGERGRREVVRASARAREEVQLTSTEQDEISKFPPVNGNRVEVLRPEERVIEGDRESQYHCVKHAMSTLLCGGLQTKPLLCWEWRSIFRAFHLEKGSTT